MQETTTSHRTGMRPWLVSLLLLLALAVGAGAGALFTQAHQPSQAAASPVCLSSAQNVTWPAPATQVMRYNPPSTVPATVTLQPSQTLEIDLFGRWIWQLRNADVSPALKLEAPAGYADALGESCIWRFTAQQAGVVQLQFFGNGMCQAPAATCVAAFFNLTVTVTASAQAS